MSTCFKIVVSQPASIHMGNKQPGGVRPNASDSVCSATFINFGKPISNGSTVHLNMRVKPPAAAGMKRSYHPLDDAAPRRRPNVRQEPARKGIAPKK